MNPENKEKEKAKELYNLYYTNILTYAEELSQEITISLLAKKSALIAIDELIEEIDFLFIMEGAPPIANSYDYWVKVKQEIEKL